MRTESLAMQKTPVHPPIRNGQGKYGLPARIAFIGLFVVAIAFFIMHWRHIRWRLGSESNMGYVEKTEVTTFQVVRAPTTWRPLEIGELSISVPPTIIEDPLNSNQRGSSGLGGSYRMSGGGRSIVVVPPINIEAFYREMEVELRLLGETRFSFARTMTEIYLVGTCDFRWSMTNVDLAKHIWLIRHARFGRIPRARCGEAILHNDFEGILLWRDQDAVFEWCCPSHVTSGSLIFHSDTPGDDIWVRQVCSSVRHSRPQEEQEAQPPTENAGPSDGK